MDLRNVIFAIALSFAVLFGWSVIFESPQIQEQIQDQDQKTQDLDAPSVNIEKKDIRWFVPLTYPILNSLKVLNQQ